MKELTEALDLGELIENPKEVKGGLLHKMYRVTTSKGEFAVKVMNPEVMKRPGVESSTINSEKIASIFGSSIPVVSACVIRGRQLHHINGQYYMIFPWVEGRSVFPPDITKEHCEIVGDILGKIHQTNITPEGIKKEQDHVPMYEWDNYLQIAGKQKSQAGAWLFQYEKAVKDLYAWNRAACEVQDVLAENLVLSHRDLDPKNVMWDGMKPFVIDWEAAGYVNPYQEFLEVLNTWADDGKGTLLKTHFDAMADAYGKHVNFRNAPWEQVFAGSYTGMLGWLAYNVRRALGIEASDKEEIRLGVEQVQGIITELYDYQKKLELLNVWLRNNR